MTDKLDSQALSDLVEYRMQRAAETLVASDFLASGNYYNLAVGRLYYACFYAASALMVYNGLNANTHAGIKAMLNLNFIRKGLLEQKFGAIYQELFEKRQSGDYEDFIYCDFETFENLRPKAESFVTRISELLRR